MIRYRRKRETKAWIIGVIVFILAMIITFADVYSLS